MAQRNSTNVAAGPATVDNMIGWLEEDGFYRGIVGWKSDWTREEVYGSPPSEPLVLGFTYGAGDHQGPPVPPQRDFDENAGLRKQAEVARRGKQVKRMIRENKSLIPAALKEIDYRLLQAGFSPKDLQALDTGHATDAYAKLQKLSEITGPPPPPPRVRFQVISDVRPGKLEKVDIYLPRNCTLGDFEETVANHRLVQFLRMKQWEADMGRERAKGTSANGVNSNLQPETNPERASKTPTVERRVWMYHFVAEGEQPEAVDEGTWKKIRDQYDFERLMRELLNDGSKLAMVCHVSEMGAVLELKRGVIDVNYRVQESTLGTTKSPTPPEVDPVICEPTDEEIDWEEFDREVDGWFPIPNDFDFSKLCSEETPRVEEYGSPELPHLPASFSGPLSTRDGQISTPFESGLSPRISE